MPLTPRHSAFGDGDGTRQPGADGPPEPQRDPPPSLHAIYLGARTIVFGRGGLTVHRHTRGTIDRSAALFGFGRLKRARKPRPGDQSRVANN